MVAFHNGPNPEKKFWDDPTPENYTRAIQADENYRITRMISICSTIVIVTFLSCCLTYCMTPASIDPNEMAYKQIELTKVKTCLTTGGSWIPVETSNGHEMSCVKLEALPYATKSLEQQGRNPVTN